MWTVIRRHQGLSANTSPFDHLENEEKYERHQTCILMHETKANVPSIDPKVFTKAFDRLIFEKISRWLLDENPEMRIQAADQLIELYIEKRENCILSLSYDILPILITLLCTDEVAEIRERAAAALEIVVKEPMAQDFLIKMEKRGEEPLERLLGSTSDPCDAVVVLALRVLIACNSRLSLHIITESLVQLGCIHSYLKLLVERENPIVKAVVCSALLPTFDVKESFITFLAHEGMRLVTAALRIDDATLISTAAEVISRAAEFPEGKRDAVRCRTLEALQPYLNHENLTTRVSVVAALAQLTVLEPAKYQSVEINLPQDIIQQISVEEERDVLIFLAKLIYNIAEFPEGREKIRSCQVRLQELLPFAGDDVNIVAALNEAIGKLSQRSKPQSSPLINF